MEKIFERLIESELAELKGLIVDATIPVSESLANEVIELTLQGNPQIESCRIHIHGQNRITLEVKSTRWPWPLTVKLKLFGSVDFTHAPAMRAFLENHALLGKLGSLFNMLPDGIGIYEDQLSIRIESFLPGQELKRLLGLLQAMDIRTEEGRIFFDIQIRK